jgi:hypothetical protein
MSRAMENCPLGVMRNCPLLGYPTEIKSVDGKIYAKRREDGKYILIPSQKIDRNRDNPDGRNHLCAPPPGFAKNPVDTVYCFALGGAT